MKRYINYLTLAGLLISSVSAMGAEVTISGKVEKNRTISEVLIDAKNGVQTFVTTTLPNWIKANPGRSAAIGTTLVGLYAMYKTCPWFQNLFGKEVKATVNIKQTPKAA